MAIKASKPFIVVEREFNGNDKVVVDADGIVRISVGGRYLQASFRHGDARRLAKEIIAAIAEYEKEYFSWHYRPAKENPEGGDAEGGAE